MTPAILGVVIGAGIIFFITAYCLQIAWPEAASMITDPDVGIYDFYPAIDQAFMADVFFVVDNFASFVCALAGMGAVSRLLFGMGRDNILPKKFFGKLSPKFQTPVNNILLTSVIALTGIFYADNLLGAAELVSFGAILGFIMVNVAVINHYYIRGGNREGAKNKIMYLIAPGIGAAVSFRPGSPAGAKPFTGGLRKDPPGHRQSDPSPGGIGPQSGKPDGRGANICGKPPDSGNYAVSEQQYHGAHGYGRPGGAVLHQ
jgi:hypothetical protein